MAQLTDSERTRVQTDLTTAGDRVLSVARALSPAHLRFRSRHDRWSIIEIIEHLSIVDSLVLGQVIEIIATDCQPKESAWKGRDDFLVSQVRSRQPALTAPEIIAPHGELEPGATLDRFESGRSRICEFIRTTTAPLRNYCFPHPVLGSLDCYQWLLCSGAHYERHLEQINEIREGPDFISMLG
jgi:hypothetical protein